MGNIECFGTIRRWIFERENLLLGLEVFWISVIYPWVEGQGKGDQA
jgi:hypothetical protein